MFEKELRKLEEILTVVTQTNNSELHWIEFKTNFVDEKERFRIIGENITGIANSCAYHKQNYGFILCGVKDGTVEEVGVNFDPFNMKVGDQDFEMTLRTMLTGVDFELLPFKKDEKSFLLIEITKAQGRISTFQREPYFRQGKNIKKLSACSQEIQMKMHYSIKRSEFWNRAVKSNLSPSYVLKYLEIDSYYLLQSRAIPTNNELVLKDFEDEEFLTKGDNGFNITYLGALLFSRNLNDFDDLQDKRVRVITYKGNTKLDNPIQDIIGQSGYASAFEKIINYIKSQIPEEQVIESALRTNKTKYPVMAIRELLANAIIHQDFLETGTNPTVEIYTDRIEFINAGECLVEPNRIMDSVPKTRNEKLVDIMRRLRICELRGSGIDRAIGEILSMQLPAPVFENKPNGFIAKIFSYKPYRNLTEAEKVRACYFHVCYQYINGQKANNESLRPIFGLSERNHTMMSRLIKKCLKLNIIKVFDPNNKSNKYISYIPNWA